MPASPVEFVREEVACRLDIWSKLEAAFEGEEAVKKLGTKILPIPSPEDTGPENMARYVSYLSRAVWYNVAARTLAGLVGYVFAKEPTINLPGLLEPLETNVDGAGLHLTQQAKMALRMILGYGRAALLVDYPVVESGVTTLAEIQAGKISPTIVLLQPWNVINWKLASVGAYTYLSLVVVKERTAVTIKDDEFQNGYQLRYRVLTCDGRSVKGRIFTQSAEGGPFEASSEYELKGHGGAPLDAIPFTFLGSTNNDSDVDGSPMLDLTNLNFAHFRNSADYEDSCYMTGQPTPWISGLTEQWVKAVLGGRILLGSRAAIALPVGAQCGLIQAAANTMPFEAMEHKERQMVSLGAKLVEQKEVQRTATEAGLDHVAEVSVLASAAQNLFEGYRTALKFCGQFVGTDEAQIEFELTEPLTKDIVTPEQANALVAMWQAGLIDFEEARASVKKAGLAWKEDSEVEANVANEGLPGQPKPGTEDPLHDHPPTE